MRHLGDEGDKVRVTMMMDRDMRRRIEEIARRRGIVSKGGGIGAIVRRVMMDWLVEEERMEEMRGRDIVEF